LAKSPEAFRTISEVAAELDVQQHVLRFWESKFPEIKPLKRGGGRRYYRPEDVALLQRIRHLLYEEKYTIKGVQQMFRDQGSAAKKAPVADSLSVLQRRAIEDARGELIELRKSLLTLTTGD